MKMMFDRTIDAPPQRVFDVFTDLEHAAERIRGIDKMEVLTPGAVGKGTQFRETRTIFKKQAVETMTITEFEPGQKYATTAESCGCRYDAAFYFEPDGNGTHVRFEMTGTPQTFMAKLMMPLAKVMAGSMKKMIAADFDDLADVAKQQGNA